MRYLFVWGMIICFREARSVQLAPCDQNVVTQAFAEGFFDHVLLNCVIDDTGTKLTIAGKSPVDQAVCLSLFVTEYKDVGPYPLIPGTSCGAQLQNFIGSSRNIRPSLAGYTYNAVTQKLQFDFDYTSWSTTYGPIFLSFASSAGATMGANLCTGYMVRDLAKKKTLAGLVIAGAGGVNFDWLSFPDIGACTLCYGQFMQYIATRASAPEKVLCNVADPSVNACYQSQTVSTALIWFNTCAGFPITFTGPLCSVAYVSKIEDFLPYYTMTSCLINLDPGMCSMMSDLLGNIESTSDVTCTKCYQEFYDGLTRLLTSNNTQVVAACSSSMNSVWATECIQILTDLLSTFNVCAGVPLDIDEMEINIGTLLSSALTTIK